MASILSYTHAGATLVAELRNEGTGVGPGPFLLIHGIGMGRSVFTDLISHLDDAAPVVAVDLPGYGEAPPPVRVLTMERTADLLAAFLEHHIRVPVVAIGHSMGSQIVVELAARHRRARPRRPAPLVHPHHRAHPRREADRDSASRSRDDDPGCRTRRRPHPPVRGEMSGRGGRRQGRSGAAASPVEI
ncbi:alpha/beta fold hydrolase [Microbacterium aurantiacum]|uniref:alpha/beta fold hydrolase n=1 Tax=Microbacterium aurantiacum TaxID=162393 RepID=UPI003F49A2D2